MNNVMLETWWMFDLRVKIRENRHFTDHVQVAHDQNVAQDQKIWIIKKFEQKIDFGEKYVFGQISGQTWKKVIFGDFGDMCHCGLPGSQAMGMIWVS